MTYDREALVAKDLTADKDADYMIGFYVIGDTADGTTAEYGVFVTGQSPEDLHFYEMETVKAEEGGDDLARIIDLEGLQALVADKNLTIYEGEPMVVEDPDSTYAARYEPLPEKARSSLLDILNQ